MAHAILTKFQILCRITGGGFTTCRGDGACAGVAAWRKPAVRRSPRSGEPDCGLARRQLGKSRVADFA